MGQMDMDCTKSKIIREINKVLYASGGAKDKDFLQEYLPFLS